MHTSGLVLTLTDDSGQATEALTHIAAAGPFWVDEADGLRRAVVMEVADPKAAHDWHDWISVLPGVECVEVVFVHWDELESEVTHVGV